MFIAVSFTIVKLEKQPKCLSKDKWIKKLWYIYTTDYDTGVKKKELLSFWIAWLNLEIMTLSKISQSAKDKYHMMSLICRI